MSKRLTVPPETLALNPELRGVLRTETDPDTQADFDSTPDAVKVIGRPARSHVQTRALEEWAPAVPGVFRIYDEPISFRLSTQGVKLRRYTPDIILQVCERVNEAPRLWFIEVKVSWKSHASGRSSKINIEHAAAEYRDLGRWFVLMPAPRRESANGWKLTELVATKERPK